jgi:hypothetical protein
VHVSEAMTELVAARDWLTVYRLPPYAHELNPVEPVWSHLKRSLANLAKRNLAQLTALIKTRLKRMQYRPGLLDGFLARFDRPCGQTRAVRGEPGVTRRVPDRGDDLTRGDRAPCH